jgi:predicted ArsR family transcriptional regulator
MKADDADPVVARYILKLLARSSNKSAGEMAGVLHVDLAQIDRVVAELVNRRLIEPIERRVWAHEPETVYRLSDFAMGALEISGGVFRK